MPAALTSYSQALRIILDQAARSSLDSELIPLIAGCDCVLAEDLISPEALPAFATSTVDGFAVRSEQTLSAAPENPLRLPVLGSLAAGDAPPAEDDRFGAWEIMTGAPVPAGFDACLRWEDVKIISQPSETTRQISLTRSAEKNENRRAVGEDFQIHDLLLKKGHRLRPEDLLALAALGIHEVFVFQKPRIAIISTGKELVPFTETPGPGQIRNANAPFMISALRKLGAEAELVASVGDDPQTFQESVRRLEKYDLLITTGGLSTGKYDFVVSALQELNCEFFFRKVSARPGKPIVFGRLPTGCFVLGLPGSPISTVVGLRFFAAPFLRVLQMTAPEIPLRLPLAHEVRKAPGLTRFLKGHLLHSEKGSWVRLHKNQDSSSMNSLLESSVWVLLPDDSEQFSQGSLLDIYPF